MKISRCITISTAGVLVCGLAGISVGVGPAWAAGITAHGYTLSLDFSSNPNTTLNPQVGPPFVVPANCPFDQNAVFTITGNANQHQTGNKNGFWAGGTITGSATLSEGAGPALYTGQATGWFGFGTNQSVTDTTGQAEEGETFHFHGTNSSGQSLDVSLDFHGTINNNGTLTNFSEDFSCR